MREFVTDEKGNRTKVILSVEEYERLLEAVEDLEDIASLEQTRALREQGKLETVPWEQVRDKIGSEYEPPEKP